MTYISQDPARQLLEPWLEPLQNADVQLLRTASFFGQENLVNSLVAQIALLDEHQTALDESLQIALNRNHQSIAQVLIKAGANMNAIGGANGLGFAAAMNTKQPRQDVIKLVLRNQSNSDVDGAAAIKNAIRAEDRQLVQQLVMNGANINILFDGNSALETALRGETVRLLGGCFTTVREYTMMIGLWKVLP